VLSGRVTPIRTHVPEMPEKLDGFFADALSPAQSRRPRRASAFVTELARALD
jgi:hypothetical protein